MKITGYSVSESELPIEEVQFIDLAQVSLEANPQELRKIAGFLMAAADDMEKMGERYDHEHLCDKQSGFEGSPHIIVFQPSAE